MAKVIAQRMTADMEGDFVVFLIGMRINAFWKVRSWWQVFVAMPRMLDELGKRPESGFLGAHFILLGPRMPAVLQYWRSFEDLERYARAKDAKHFPAWVKFNRTIGSSGSVGIWHETYRVGAGQYETIYNNLPLFGAGEGLARCAGCRLPVERSGSPDRRRSTRCCAGWMAGRMRLARQG